MTRTNDTETRWRAACQRVAQCQDVLHGRPSLETAPDWARRRGWDGFLDRLTDAEVETCEAQGPARCLPRLAGVPASLRELAEDVEQLVDLPQLQRPEALLTASSFPRASERKRLQLAAFALVARGVATGAARVVDVGSGHGHLTRHLAQAFSLPAVGLERDAARVAVARRLVMRPGVSFETREVGGATMGLRADELAVGLHACGELGDSLVQAAVTSGSAVALVACCQQKRVACFRAPWVVPAGMTAEELTVQREVLGLTNLASRSQMVEAPLVSVMDSRRKRIMVGVLLELRGVSAQPGEEMHGVNRRWALADDGELAQRVLAQRGLAAPTDGELQQAQQRALRISRAVRRHALPRVMLGRLLEVTILLDRALVLLGRGRAVTVGQLFPVDVSPRNLVLLSGR